MPRSPDTPNSDAPSSDVLSIDLIGDGLVGDDLIDNDFEAAPPLDILYQDDVLVIVLKPSGLLVHRSPIDRHETEFLLQRLRDQIGQHVFPVHRLDRPTSGLMVFGLSPSSARKLSAAFEEQLVSKRYLAVVRGVAPEHERLDYGLRKEDGRLPKAQMPEQDAITDIRRLAQVELPVAIDRYLQSRFSLVEARPLTGRRHQIRRHLSRRGYPIIGDAKHGKGIYNRYFGTTLECPRLLLAAVGLELPHPDGGWLSLSCPPQGAYEALMARFGWLGHLPERYAKHLPERPAVRWTTPPASDLSD